MKRRLLIVDDESFNRDFLEMHLLNDYYIDKAENGIAALEKMTVNRYAVVLLDINMPNMNGIEVLDVLSKKNMLDQTPVIVITGDDNEETENECLAHGAIDFVSKPINVNILKKRVMHIADVYELKNHFEETVENQTETLQMQNEELELQTRKLKDQAKLLQKQTEKLELQAKRLRYSNKQIIDILGTVVEYRDIESGEHIERVRAYIGVLARSMMEHYPEYGLNEEQISMIESASPLHDVGKIAIPDKILLKPGKLTSEEFEIMKEHTIKGCEIINSIRGFWSTEYRNLCMTICRHHHERYDGNGYPDKLKGDEIPIAAQLVSLADVYDALVNKRVYKKAYGKEEAYKMILNGECGVFSPKLLTCFSLVRNEFENISEKRMNQHSDMENMKVDDVFGTRGDRFMEQISHEIRTPLNVIIGMAGLAKEEVVEKRKAYDYLSNIEDNSRILLNLVNDIIDLSSLENGKLLIRNAKYDLKEQITSLGLSFYEQAKQKNINFNIHVKGVTEEYVIGDELRISQMLMNIVSNSFRFTPEGGNVDMTVQQGSTSRNRTHMRFIIKDNSEGMSHEMIQNIISPDYQKFQTKVGTKGETGLSMYISKQLSELMNGVLLVASEPGKGMKVTVDIPFIRTEQRKQEKFNRLLNQKVLLCCKTEGRCKEFGEILLDMGLGYDYAISKNDILDKIGCMEETKNPYQICMIDWNPDNKDALKLVEEIREIFGNEITIIITVPNVHKNREEALKAGADFVIENTVFASTIFDALISIEHGDIMKKTEEDIRLINYDFTGKRILVAEDMALNMEVIVKILSRVNASVVCVENGLEAVNTFKRKPEGFFDCILMDINMPLMDGCEATENIRKLDKADARTVPIYAMTANAFPADVVKVLDAGMDGHIAKPIEVNKLYRMLKDLFYEKQGFTLEQQMREKADYLQKENIELRKKAETDALTGLMNRYAYEKKMLTIMSNNFHMAFLLIDIDYFKQVNDKYGHVVGDKVLVRLAELLRKYFRSTDYIIRLGGDEFVVIINYFSDKEKCIEKIRKINEDLKHDRGELPEVSISAGVAFSDVGYTRELYYQADKALYRTKENGRCGCMVYED